MRRLIARPILVVTLLASISCAERTPPLDMDAQPAAPTADSTGSAVDTVDQSAEFPAIEALLRAGDTLESVQTRLGAGAVLAQEIHQAEGEMVGGWVLYPDDPTRMAEVFLDDSGLHPVLLRIDSRDSAWVRADGVRIGATSAELQALNSRPFAFSGFSWDYGGFVSDWRGGALEARHTGGGQPGSVRLSPPDNVGDDYPMGDAIFLSDDPRVMAQPARVDQFAVYIGD